MFNLVFVWDRPAGPCHGETLAGRMGAKERAASLSEDRRLRPGLNLTPTAARGNLNRGNPHRITKIISNQCPNLAEARFFAA
jgi:hypothetical protein